MLSHYQLFLYIKSVFFIAMYMTIYIYMRYIYIYNYYMHNDSHTVDIYAIDTLTYI